ncbi:MAG: hypothetical protein QM533_07815 [Cytophagales bacterium]|nr:hypothetical protein [Cytophagales bacterium]
MIFDWLASRPFLMGSRSSCCDNHSSTGADVMIGGAGNNTYYVDNTQDVSQRSTDPSKRGDQVIEAAGEGNDTVQASVKRYELDYIQGDAVPGYLGTALVTSPKAAQTFGVRPQKQTKHCKAPTTVQRGLTPIGLRQSANQRSSSNRALLARSSGVSLASHACLQAANDVAYRQAA